MRKKVLTRTEATILNLVGKRPIDPKEVEKRRSQLEHTAEKYFGKPEYDPRNL